MISPPIHVICATYFFRFCNIPMSDPSKNWSISPPTLANAQLTLKSMDNPATKIFHDAFFPHTTHLMTRYCFTRRLLSPIHGMRVTRKQTLRSLPLSYQKKDGHAWPHPYSNSKKSVAYQRKDGRGHAPPILLLV